MKKELQERLASCMHEFAAVVAAIYAEPDGQEYIAESAAPYADGEILLADISCMLSNSKKGDQLYPSICSLCIGNFASKGKTFKMYAYPDIHKDKPADLDWNRVHVSCWDGATGKYTFSEVYHYVEN